MPQPKPYLEFVSKISPIGAGIFLAVVIVLTVILSPSTDAKFIYTDF